MSSLKHILVVEDEARIALDIQSTLSDLGHRVSTVSTTHEAEGILSTDPIDLAILDYHLRDGTSDQLARKLQQNGTLFVICSGTAGIAELQQPTILAKPFTTDADRRGCGHAASSATKRLVRSQLQCQLFC